MSEHSNISLSVTVRLVGAGRIRLHTYDLGSKVRVGHQDEVGGPWEVFLHGSVESVEVAQSAKGVSAMYKRAEVG